MSATAVVPIRSADEPDQREPLLERRAAIQVELDRLARIDKARQERGAGAWSTRPGGR
jgi:hypothetical protein